LADYQSNNLDDKVWKFIHVQVLWFGQRLKKQCPDVLIDLSRARVEIRYTGRLVSNIGRGELKD